MNITPDDIVLWQWGIVTINATLVSTWVVMIVLVLGSFLMTRGLTSVEETSVRQSMLELLVDGLQQQIQEISRQAPGPYLPYVGTLFLFIFVANVLAVVPGYRPPTASMSTTAALALSVFVAVPVFGIASEGVGNYLRHYTRPTVLMLPFNIIGEISRTFALAVRLYGNMMSGTVIVAILLGIAPLFFPVLIQILGILTGTVQAYIFAVLAMVYIASATRAKEQAHTAPVESTKQRGERT